MIKRETYVLLLQNLEQGFSNSAIAERLGIDPRVIHGWVAAGQLVPDAETGLLPEPGRRPSRPVKLAPFEAILRTRCLRSSPRRESSRRSAPPAMRAATRG